MKRGMGVGIRVRRLVGMPLAVVFLAVWLGPQARAGCGQRIATAKSASRADVQRSVKAAVVARSFVIAAPVVVIAQPAVFYRYSRYAAVNERRYRAVRRADDDAKDDSTPQPASSAASSIVARSCVTCHGGTAPKAGLDLSDVERLTPDQRLKAIARVVSDDPAERMPPGQALSPGEIGRVLQALSER